MLAKLLELNNNQVNVEEYNHMPEPIAFAFHNDLVTRRNPPLGRAEIKIYRKGRGTNLHVLCKIESIIIPMMHLHIHNF